MPANAPPRHLYWDSCVFIDYFEATPNRLPLLEDLLREVKETPDSQIYTSIITITELNHLAIKKSQGHLDQSFLSRVDAMWSDRSILTLVEFNQVIARIARDLSRQVISHGWALRPMDAIHLATAVWVKRYLRPIEEIHTYDQRLFKYDKVVNIKIIEPY